jgi:IS30 family transposase
MYCPLLHSRQTKPRKRKVHTAGKPPKRTMIPNRVSIHDRPKHVEDRTLVGNTESDTIVSAKKTGSTVAVSVMVERATCVTTLETIRTTSPKLNNTARYKMVRRMPCKILTDTDDNGIENKHHETFTKVTGIPVYFCDSHCSWQK